MIKIEKRNEHLKKIKGGFRKRCGLVPFVAFRQAIANAFIHRVWNIKANAKVEIYLDKIVISSSSGLMDSMTKEDYVNGNYSYLRNSIIADVNGSYQILLKVFPKAFCNGIEGVVLHPIIVNVA